MFIITDSDTGLTLSLTVDPKPRNPRLTTDNVFQIVTWSHGLGDPHDWPSRKAFRAAFPAETTAIFPVKKVATRNGFILVRNHSDAEPVDGYAFATFERLCIAFGLDMITADIRDETIMEAETVCLSELQDYEHFVDGDVCHFEIKNRRGECVEKVRDLYGEGFARHVAQEAFNRHLYSVTMDG
ncbi:hypothetical protein [Palleronia sp.]|uniref:hypothetical protein n=1 Tax=Palleronia sp. TaxID=1940284 RepID=UPI0035C877BD